MLSFENCFIGFFRLLPCLAWLLVVFCLLRPARIGRLAFWAAASALAALLAKRFWLRLFGGGWPDVDLPVQACVLISGAFMFGVTLGFFALLPPYRWWRARAAAFAVLAAALTAWGLYEGLRLPDVNSREVEVEGLPASFDGLRVVQLSDIHCSPMLRRDYVQGIVDRVNALKPDVVCITGDFVDGSPEARFADLEPLSDIRARLGVFGCSGNHEFYSGYDRWRWHFERFGIRMLDNACATLTNGTDAIAIGGVTDPAGVRFGWPGPDVEAAFSNAPATTCRILLAHRPTELAAHARHGVRLQLSGHTHGAAIWGLAWLPVAWMNDFHVKGLYREGGATLYVTPGSGQWMGYPLRIGTPSEIAAFTLRSGLMRP